MAFLAPFVDGYQFNQRFRGGFWDGRKHLYTIENKNVQFPKGLVEYIIKELQDSNLEFEYKTSSDKTNIIEDDFKEFTSTLNLPFKPYDYQLKCSYDMIKNKRGLFSAATSCLEPESKIKCLISDELYNKLNS